MVERCGRGHAGGARRMARRSLASTSARVPSRRWPSMRVGRKLAAASRARRPLTRMPTGGEHDPDAIFETAVSALAEVAAGLRGRPVAGIAATSIGESCVLIDAEGRALAPSIAWYDRRTTQDAAAIVDAVGQRSRLRDHRRRRRIQLHAGQADVDAAGLAGGLRQGPARDADGGLDRLSAVGGRRDRPDAGCPDPVLRRWRECLVGGDAWPSPARDADFPAPIRVGGTALGPVKDDVLAATGLAGRPIVGVGGHDHIVGAMACGFDRPGTLVDSMGTAEPLLLGSKPPVSDWDVIRRGYLQAPIRPGRNCYWIGGSVFTSGGAVEWVRALTGGADQATLIAEAAAMPAGSEGVVFVPHVGNGVSPPDPDLDARGAFLGLTVGAGRAVLYRCRARRVGLPVAIDPRRHDPVSRSDAAGWFAAADRRRVAEPALRADQGECLRPAGRPWSTNPSRRRSARRCSAALRRGFSPTSRTAVAGLDAKRQDGRAGTRGRGAIRRCCARRCSRRPAGRCGRSRRLLPHGGATDAYSPARRDTAPLVRYYDI